MLQIDAEKNILIYKNVRFPDEFAKGNFMNGIAFTPDGKKYAYISNEGKVVVENVPSNGKFNVGDFEVYCDPETGSISVKQEGSYTYSGDKTIKTSVSGGSVNISNIGNTYCLESKIDND